MPSQLGVQRLQQQQPQSPQQVTQAQGTNPDMMQALVKVITDQILAPPPQMPQPPQQQGLSNLDAFAAVRNPQAMPYLMERAQAPAQAQFQQKQQMFEQAMKQRGDAMRYGVDLLQLGESSAQRDVMNQIRMGQLDVSRQNAATAQERVDLQRQLGDIRSSQADQGLALRELGLGLREREFESRTTKRPLPASITTNISEQSTALEAAKQIQAEYDRLGRPDIGRLFTLTPDRMKNPKGIEFSRVMSEALVPLRKYFLGSAVSQAEREAAGPLLANLEAGVAPKVLQQSIIGLVNIAERARRQTLESSELAGFDVSGFTSSTPPGGASPRTLNVVIDEQGNLKIEE